MCKLLAFINERWSQESRLTLEIRFIFAARETRMLADQLEAERPPPRSPWNTPWLKTAKPEQVKKPQEDEPIILPVTPAIRYFHPDLTGISLPVTYETRLPPDWLPRMEAAMPMVAGIGLPLRALTRARQESIYRSLVGLLDWSSLQALSLDLMLEPVAGRNDNHVTDAFQALHKLSTGLRRLIIKGDFIITPDFFWPPPATDSLTERTNDCQTNDDDTVLPFWPHLELLEIRLSGMFHIMPRRVFTWSKTPAPYELDESEFEHCEWDEEWDLHPDPGDSARPHARDDEPVLPRQQQPPFFFSSDADAENWNPPGLEPINFDALILAMSRSMLRMPKLQVLILACASEEVRKLERKEGCLRRSANRGAFPFYYDNLLPVYPVQTGPRVYTPLIDFQEATKRQWKPPAEVLRNWHELRRRRRRELGLHIKDTGKFQGKIDKGFRERLGISDGFRVGEGWKV